MTAFRIEVVVDPAKGTQGVAEVKRSLVDLDRQATKTVALMDSIFDDVAREAKQARDAIEEQTRATKRQGESLGIVSRQVQIQNQLRAVATREASRGAAADAASAAAKQRQATAGASAAAVLQREAQVLRSINGPMDEYKADVAALTALWQRGTITAAQYNAQLARSASTARQAAGTAPRGGFGGSLASLGALGPAAGAAGAALAVRELAQLSDQYTNLQNRLGTVKSAGMAVGDMSDRLYALAQKTRVEWSSVSEVFVRTSSALNGLGYSTEQTLSFTETLSKAVKLSGASATEANNAMIQLSQGLSSGALRGDELRSVLEQLPTVADVIAKGFGVTRGELRKLGEDGKISTSQIIDAFAKAKSDIDGDFGKLAPTFGEQWTTFKNLMTKVAGEMLSSLGPLISAFSKVISLYDDLKSSKVGSALIGGLGQTKELPTTLLLADAWVAVADAKAKAAGEDAKLTLGYIQVVREVDYLAEVSKAWADQQAKDAASVKTGMDALARSFAIARQGLIDMAVVQAQGFAKMAVGFNSLRDSADPAGAALRKLATDGSLLRDAVAAGLVPLEEANKILDALADTTTGASVAAKAGADGFAALMDRVRGYRDEVDPVGAAQRDLAKVQADLTNAVDRDKISQEQAIDIYERKAFAVRELLDPAGAYLDVMRRETELLKLGGAEREATIALEEYLNTLRKAGLDITLQRIVAFSTEYELLRQAQADSDARDAGAARLADDTSSIFGKVGDAFDASNAKRARQEAKDARLEIKNTEKDFASSFDGIYRNATDVASATAAAWNNAFASMEDALVSFVTTGKLDFHALTQSILADITRILIRQALVAVFGRPAGATGAGGTASLLGGLLGFATGGSFTVGGSGGTDTTPVMFRATPGERVTVQTPAQQAAASGPVMSSAPVIHNNVVIDSGQMLQVLQSPGGKRMLTEVIRANPQLFRAALR